MGKERVVFFCQECGYETPKWLGRCPGCSAWNTFQEELHRAKVPGKIIENNKPKSITKVEIIKGQRIKTGIMEVDRTLGGGIMPASVILLGGNPGVGKSTLLLQISSSLCNHGQRVLYISGEESLEQIKQRGNRLGVSHEELFLSTENSLEYIKNYIENYKPNVVIIDSIQTVYTPELSSAPGTVSQVRDCTASLSRFVKEKGVSLFLVGHVTKDGMIAGPKVLEHMVDCVLSFDGDRHYTYRLLRSVKNRFGPANEIGVFSMAGDGLQEVSNPSEFFLSNKIKESPGSVVTASMEGSRPLLVEIQSLLSPARYSSPRRMTTGIDSNRVALLMAVLEKKAGLFLQDHDVFVNVVGGVRLQEPAVDLPVAMALASSFRDKALRSGDIFFGEVGLTGEIRNVRNPEGRINEGIKLGFNRFIIPKNNTLKMPSPKNRDMEIIRVSDLGEALEVAVER